jgi:hypothetical protein
MMAFGNVNDSSGITDASLPGGGRTTMSARAYNENNATANVFDFGAAGDGVADDTLAFRKAVATGRPVTSWPGARHLISTVIPINTSGQRLEGRGATLLASTPLTSLFAVGDDGKGRFVKTDNVLIEDWNFVGKADGHGKANPPFAIGVVGPTVVPYAEGAGCSHLTVRNCTEKGFCFGLAATGADDLQIVDCTVGGNFYYPALAAGGYGVLLQTCFRVQVVRIKGTAARTDRHAVYVSADPDRKFDNNNVCKNIQVVDPDLDWRGVSQAPTKFEAVIVTRSPENFTLSGGHLRGGYGGVDYDGENGNGTNFVVRGTVFDGTFAGHSERGCIDVIRSAGSYILDGCTITGCTFKPIGPNMHAVVLSAVKNFNVSGNTGSVTESIDLVQVAGHATDGYLGGNTWNNHAQHTYDFSGPGNARITIGKDQGSLSGGAVMYRFLTTPAGLKFGFPRSATVNPNSPAEPTAGSDQYGIVDRLVSTENGFALTFADCVDTPAFAKLLAASHSPNVGSINVHSIAGQTVVFAVVSHAGRPMPAASNRYALTVQVTE